MIYYQLPPISVHDFLFQCYPSPRLLPHMQFPQHIGKGKKDSSIAWSKYSGDILLSHLPCFPSKKFDKGNRLSECTNARPSKEKTSDYCVLAVW